MFGGIFKGENYMTSLKQFLFLYFFLSKVDFVFFLKVFACSQFFFKLCRKKLTLSVYCTTVMQPFYACPIILQCPCYSGWHFPFNRILMVLCKLLFLLFSGWRRIMEDQCPVISILFPWVSTRWCKHEHYSIQLERMKFGEAASFVCDWKTFQFD